MRKSYHQKYQIRPTVTFFIYSAFTVYQVLAWNLVPKFGTEVKNKLTIESE